ncbi:MAG: fumarate hydratase, partial [Butyricicoccus sp.]|nr:fumarate hydratase [Butyricicoccus sp.]
MRTVKAAAVTDTVARLCVKANRELPEDVSAALAAARESEPWPLAEKSLGILCGNLELAREKELPICQDTGLACVFIELGQEVHVEGGLEQAVNEGVRRGYGEGYLRKSVVGDPLRRVNTGDNTPAFITLHLVPGDGFRVTVLPKGFGSENMSRLKMLKPADGVEGVKDFVIETVRLAGANPCPPVVVGVGVGGCFDKAAYLA